MQIWGKYKTYYSFEGTFLLLNIHSIVLLYRFNIIKLLIGSEVKMKL